MVKSYKAYEQSCPRKTVLFLDGKRFMAGCDITSIDVLDERVIETTSADDRHLRYIVDLTIPPRIRINYEFAGRCKHVGSKVVELSCELVRFSATSDEIYGDIDGDGRYIKV